LLIFNILQFFSNLSAFKCFARFLADVGKMWGKNFGYSKDKYYLCIKQFTHYPNNHKKDMKVTFIIKKSAKRYDTESTATIYLRLRDGRRLDSVAQTELTINPNLWDEKNECVKSKAICDPKLRT
jgi:hypothetical protein